MNGNESLVNVSQIIISTTQDSVYDNKLHVRGRISGLYHCVMENNFPSLSLEYMNIAGNYIHLYYGSLECLAHFFSCRGTY